MRPARAGIAGAAGATGTTGAQQAQQVRNNRGVDGQAHEYQTLARPAAAELEISRSRFLAHIERVTTEAEARAVITSVREQHPRARHHCTAFVLGASQRTQRSSDDGEPSGTAGAPMLDALVSAGLSDVVAVVTRYFGGVLLGAGGLTRAYRAAVAEAVLGAQRVTRAPRQLVGIHTTYDVAPQLESEARRRNWIQVTAHYTEQVSLTLAVPPSEVDAVAALAAELSAGQTQVSLGEVAYFDL